MRAAIIPARGGSQRLAKKNIRDFHGHPIIAYAIACAKLTTLFDRIIVSTDDPEIGKIAYDRGAEYMKRHAALAHNDVGTQEVAKSVIETLGPGYKMACVIYPCTPLLTPEDLRIGYKACCNAAYSMSVGAEPLRDAGAFYWGYTWAFLQDIPLIGPSTAMVPLPEERVCDVNTEEDWTLMTKLYDAGLVKGRVDA